MTAQVYIVLDSVNHALLVPSSALSTRSANGQGQSNRNKNAAASSAIASHKKTKLMHLNSNA